MNLPNSPGWERLQAEIRKFVEDSKQYPDWGQDIADRPVTEVLERAAQDECYLRSVYTAGRAIEVLKNNMLLKMAKEEARDRALFEAPTGG